MMVSKSNNMITACWLCCLLVATTQTAVFGFVIPQTKTASTTELNASRRSVMGQFASAIGLSILVGAPSTSFAKEERQGIEVTPFNGLNFNYRGSQYGGLDASTITEPSVPYVEFCERLKAGQVEFVEFLAPDGDIAYVTFKPSQQGEPTPAPIRIGEGYPIEQHDGWSSPAFAIRTVKNAGVPYKFVVPGLGKYSS